MRPRTRGPLFLTVTTFALACASAPGTVRTDIDVYLRRTKAWAPIEAETARTIERILRTQFVDEAEVQRQIADSRPRVVTHLEQIRDYTPRASTIAGIHAHYVQAWERLLAGYDAIEKGFASGDYTQLARGRDAMSGWREELIRVAADLRELRQRMVPDASGTIGTRALPPVHFSTQST